jgi:hypothetical protein
MGGEVFESWNPAASDILIVALTQLGHTRLLLLKQADAKLHDFENIISHLTRSRPAVILGAVFKQEQDCKAQTSL